MAYHPPMYLIRQHFPAESITDIPAAVRKEFESSGIAARVKPGQRVAVCSGSRGIANIPVIIKAVVDNFKALGLRPVVVPAMGSHGNANAVDQLAVLRDLGLTEESVGAPFESDMEVVSFGVVETGAEVFFARHLLAFDHIFPVNRVKPHTSFRGRVESGMSKMLAVGCGKHVGASNMHKYSLAKTIEPAAARIIEKAPVLGGLGIVENAREKTHTIRLALAETMLDTDAELLKTAWENFPRLPFDALDILYVDEMGKNISGTGMDTNVVGLWRREGGERKPDYATLAVFSITPESHGNAMGFGLADLIPRSMMDAISLEATYMNGITAGIWRGIRTPVVLPTVRDIVEVTLSKLPESKPPRIARIRNTLLLDAFWATEALVRELSGKDGITVEGKTETWNFGPGGELRPFALA